MLKTHRSQFSIFSNYNPIFVLFITKILYSLHQISYHLSSNHCNFMKKLSQRSKISSNFLLSALLLYPLACTGSSSGNTLINLYDSSLSFFYFCNHHFSLPIFIFSYYKCDIIYGYKFMYSSLSYFSSFFDDFG